MSNKILSVLFVFLLTTVPVFGVFGQEEEVGYYEIAADYETTEYYVVEVEAAEVEVAEYEAAEIEVVEVEVAEIEVVEYEIPEGLRNNVYFRESLRLTQLAIETFEFGDYDASAAFAEEAIRFAELSDEYVASHLIVQARNLLDWAAANSIQESYPNEYSQSTMYYETAVITHALEDWDASIEASITSIGILARFHVEDDPRPAPVRVVDERDPSVLPSQYTVRTWAGERDSLWTIAGRSWAYGDPWQWRVLFEANRHRMPDPNNPDLIEPGFVLDIPSIRGETRQGMWSPDRTYTPFGR